MARQLRLPDFYGADFDVDEFVGHAIGPRLGHAMMESEAAAFDPEAILEALLATKGEVDSLRADANTRVRSALDRVEKLSDRHMRGVKELRGDADQVLGIVQDLQGTVGSMGAKAVTMGRHLDKIDQERRRACDAAQAIRIYEVLCSEDDDAAARAIKALVPDKAASRRNDVRASEGKTSALLDSALMLRKLQAAAFVATGEGAKRARARLDEAGKSLEYAAVLCFDEASARCESELLDGHSGALNDMRAAVDALLYYNGGETMMHRYVSTRKPFIDPDVIMGDRLAVEQVSSYSDAVVLMQRLVSDMLAFLQGESRLLPHIFAANDAAVKLMLLQRLCYERLAPSLDGVMQRLRELHDAAVAPEAVAGGADHGLAASNLRLDAAVGILQACALFLTRLEAGVGLSGPLADKEAREEISDMLDDMLAPYVSGFVPEQLGVLAAHLARYLPSVTSAHSVEYDLDVDAPLDLDPSNASVEGGEEHGREEGEGADDAGAETASGSEGEERDARDAGRGGHALARRASPPAAASEESSRSGGGEPGGGGAGRAKGRGALAWAARKSQELSSNLHLPGRHDKSRTLGKLWRGKAPPADGTAAKGAGGDAREGSDVLVVVRLSNVRRAVLEVRAAMLRVMAVEQSYRRSTQRAQSALKVLGSYIETYNVFLYGCVQGAAEGCRQQLQACTDGRLRVEQHLAAPAVALLAVSGAAQLHDMVAHSPLTAAAASDVRASASLVQMLQRSDGWTQGALNLLSGAMVQATVDEAAHRLQACRSKDDYTGEAVTSGLPQATRACTECVALVRSVALAWLSRGPTTRHSIKVAVGGADQAEVTAEGSLCKGLDANSTYILVDLAEGVAKVFRAHVLKQRYSAQGAVRLLNDVAALEQLSRDLGAPHVVQSYDVLSQAANILVLNAETLPVMLEDKTGLFSEPAVFECMLQLISLRADWPQLRPHLGSQIASLQANLTSR